MRMPTIHRPPSPHDGDFCWGIEGEIAIPPAAVCDTPHCGCDRTYTGLNSRRASTTVMVRDVDLTLDDLIIACIPTLQTSGLSPDETIEYATDLITESADTANLHPVGTVLRMHFDGDIDDWLYHEA